MSKEPGNTHNKSFKSPRKRTHSSDEKKTTRRLTQCYILKTTDPQLIVIA